MIKMTKELLAIEKLELVPFFTKGDQLDDTLAKIKAEAVAHVPNVSTLKGRNAIKANVTKVTKSKVFLEGHGKGLAAEYKLIPKAIDANRKKSRDFLTALVDEIREPLTAWEAIDKAEKSQVIDTEAFLIQYELQHEDGLRDNELIDLKAAQDEANRAAEIKAATDKAAAEAKAKAELEASERIAKAEREKIAAEQREIAAKAAADKAESNRIAQEERAKIEAAEAARREELAKWVEYISEAYTYNDQLIAAENARITEVNRQQAIAENQRQQQAQREADLDNRSSKNNAAKNAIIELGFNEEQAKAIVRAITKREIPNVQINY